MSQNKQNCKRNMRNRSTKREQPRKDSKSKRINLDNERDSKFEKEYGQKPQTADNDISWYTKNPELLKAGASLNYSLTTGSRLMWKGSSTSTSTYYSIPGVMVLETVPTIGGHSDAAVNAAKDSIYSYVVHANSRNTSYNATDLMMIILAGSQLFAAMAAGIRVYGLMRTYDQRNAYLPKALVEACGFSFEDLKSNLSRMWFDINEMIARSQQIWIPDSLPLTKRWYWLNSNVYQDSASIRGQYYVLNQYSYLMYNETLTSQGGGLSWIGKNGQPSSSTNSKITFAPNAGVTWDQYMTMMNGLFSSLLNSEDRGVMMGDMLKAYGAEHIYAIAPISVDYQITPVYDREVLTQIENATVYDTLYSQIEQLQTTLQLYTNWGNVPAGSTFTFNLPSQSMLNFHQLDLPTPEQNMIATRLKIAGGYAQVDSSGHGSLIPDTMGSEYVVSIYYCNMGPDSSVVWRDYNTYITAGSTPSFIQLWAITTFDWCPWLYIASTVSYTNTTDLRTVDLPEVSNAYGDYDYCTILDKDTLRKMHTTAVYSEFDVPTI